MLNKKHGQDFMYHYYRSHIFFLSSLLGIYLIAWFIQANIIFSSDVSWCLHAATKLLGGGNYVTDFFDVNLPLTLYLYIPSLLLAKIFSITTILSLRIFMFALITLSLYVNYVLVGKIFASHQMWLAHVFIISIAFILLVQPENNFGQREHFLLIFTLPYFLAMTLRLQNYSFKFWQVLFIGVFAGIGFIIKPYFLIALAMVELYYLAHTRRISNSFRVETIAIFLLMISYVIFIFKFYPNFVYIILPLISKYFYTEVYYVDPWKNILFNNLVFYCCLVLLFFIYYRKENTYQELSNILFISILGFFFAYLMQRNAWHHHFLPVMSMAILLFVLIFGLSLSNKLNTKYQNLFIILFGLMVSYYPISFLFSNYNAAVLEKKKTEPLVNFMKLHAANKPVYFITTSIQDPLPAIDYSNAILASRAAHFVLLPGLLKKLKSYENVPLPKELNNDKNFFTKIITDDLNVMQPVYVFVDMKKYKTFPFIFDHLAYFSKDKEFKKAWDSYQYLTTIEQSDMVKNKFSGPLYFIPRAENIYSSQIMSHHHSDKIVLTGKGLHKTAYIIGKKGILRIIDVDLSPEEAAFLDTHLPGLIEVNTENHLFLKALTKKIIDTIFPYYKLAVYQRVDAQR